MGNATGCQEVGLPRSGWASQPGALSRAGHVAPAWVRAVTPEISESTAKKAESAARPAPQNHSKV